MPRWASRITLEVTGVRVEPVQAITEADAIAEGFPLEDATPETWWQGYYRDTWDQLNAKRGYGWDLNPWVCVTTFDILEAK